MSVCSPVFLLCLAVLAVIYQLSSERWSRRLWLNAGNLAFLSTYMVTWRSWVGLAVFLAVTYGMIWRAFARPERGLVPMCLVVIVEFYLLVKVTAVLGVWQFIGVSYMLFKCIHALVDVSQRQVSPGGFLCYANYQLSFFTLVAGPIQRYGDFQSFWTSMDGGPPSPRNALNAWSRILTGMLKNGAIGPLLWQACQDAWLGVSPELAGGARFFAQFYGYPLWLYFNFSGYVDVMIGAAQLLGGELPENFHYPFLARNVIDFWNRWHITLTHWIRDYVFMTSYKAVAERLPRHSKSAGYALVFLSLLLAGVWHGATLGFAVFGGLHGLGAAINEMYGAALKRWLGREGVKRYHQSRLIRLGAIVITGHFVCFSMLFFALDCHLAAISLRDFYRWLTALLFQPEFLWLCLLIATLLLVVTPLAAWLAIYVTETATKLRGALGRNFFRASRSIRSQYGLVFAKTFFVALMFIVLWVLQQQDPIVVYQGF